MTLILEILVTVIALVIVLDLFTGFRMLKSVTNRLRKKADEIAEEVRDPVADAHAALANIRQKHSEMSELRRTLLLEVKRAKNKQIREQANVEKYENLAALAGSAGNADDVRTALERKANAQKALDAANLEAVRIQKQEDVLEEKIKEFASLIESAENDKTYLESQLRINKFNTEVNNVLKNDNGSAQFALEKLRNDVERSAMEAELSGELADEVKNLESKYLAPSTGITDDEISKYLKK